MGRPFVPESIDSVRSYYSILGVDCMVGLAFRCAGIACARA